MTSDATSYDVKSVLEYSNVTFERRFSPGFFARKMRLRANLLVDFFQTKIVDCTESVRIFLRKQYVKIINGRGGVLCTHEKVVGKGLFY